MRSSINGSHHHKSQRLKLLEKRGQRRSRPSSYNDSNVVDAPRSTYVWSPSFWTNERILILVLSLYFCVQAQVVKQQNNGSGTMDLSQQQRQAFLDLLQASASSLQQHGNNASSSSDLTQQQEPPAPPRIPQVQEPKEQQQPGEQQRIPQSDNSPTNDDNDDTSSPLVRVWNPRNLNNNNNNDETNSIFPIFNVGLPKSGGDTLRVFFEQLGYAAQLGCGDMNNPRQGCHPVYLCLQDNIGKGENALQGCTEVRKKDNENANNNTTAASSYHVYTQLYGRDSWQRIIQHLFLPQVCCLEALYQAAPHGTWILPVMKSPEQWAYSLTRLYTLREKLWNSYWVQVYQEREDGTQKKKKKKLSMADLTPGFVKSRPLLEAEWEELPAMQFWSDYYRNHTERIRQFAQAHPTLRVIELRYQEGQPEQDDGSGGATTKDAAVLSRQLLEALLPTKELDKIQNIPAWPCEEHECEDWQKEIDMIARVRQHQQERQKESSSVAQQQQQQQQPTNSLKLPSPVFVVGFPKSGTTSVYNYFMCSNVRSQHYCCCGDVSDHRPCYSRSTMAECILSNRIQGNHMLQGCTSSLGAEQDYQLFAQLDGERSWPKELEDRKKAAAMWGNGPESAIAHSAFLMSMRSKKLTTGGHFLPQIHDLDWIHQEYPNATFVLPLRDVEQWAASVSRWFNMRHRLQVEYRMREFNHSTVSLNHPNHKLNFLVDAYASHTKNVQDFVKRYPSHTLVQFNLTSPDAGSILANAFGLPESCWGHHNKNSIRKTGK